MPRPVKWRRVEFLPGFRYFIPSGVPKNMLEENIIKVEELEAIRLKDLEGLEQEQCAERMGISRQTFQRIYNVARQTIADSLINGKAIRVEGGNFTRNICPVSCHNCNHTWEESFENFEKIMAGEYHCPVCGSRDIDCTYGQGRQFCGGRCWRGGGPDRT